MHLEFKQKKSESVNYLRVDGVRLALSLYVNGACAFLSLFDAKYNNIDGLSVI